MINKFDAACDPFKHAPWSITFVQTSIFHSPTPLKYFYFNSWDLEREHCEHRKRKEGRTQQRMSFRFISPKVSSHSHFLEITSPSSSPPVLHTSPCLCISPLSCTSPLPSHFPLSGVIILKQGTPVESICPHTSVPMWEPVLNFKHRRAFVEDCGLFYGIVGRVKRLTETKTVRSVTFRHSCLE